MCSLSRRVDVGGKDGVLLLKFLDPLVLGVSSFLVTILFEMPRFLAVVASYLVLIRVAYFGRCDDVRLFRLSGGDDGN